MSRSSSRIPSVCLIHSMPDSSSIEEDYLSLYFRVTSQIMLPKAACTLCRLRLYLLNVNVLLTAKKNAIARILLVATFFCK